MVGKFARCSEQEKARKNPRANGSPEGLELLASGSGSCRGWRNNWSRSRRRCRSSSRRGLGGRGRPGRRGGSFRGFLHLILRWLAALPATSHEKRGGHHQTCEYATCFHRTFSTSYHPTAHIFESLQADGIPGGLRARKVAFPGA